MYPFPQALKRNSGILTGEIN